MSLLAKLRQRQSKGFATATSATFATHEPALAQEKSIHLLSVANVASVAVANAPNVNPDRYCWPSSQAMNTVETKTFHRRVVRFSGRAGAEQPASSKPGAVQTG